MHIPQRFITGLTTTFAVVFSLLLSAFPLASHAAGNVQETLNAPSNIQTEFSSLANSAVSSAIAFVGGLAVLVIVYGGYLYLVSIGNSGRREQAKETILYAVIGLIITLLAWVIVNLVVSVFTK